MHESPKMRVFIRPDGGTSDLQHVLGSIDLI